MYALEFCRMGICGLIPMLLALNQIAGTGAAGDDLTATTEKLPTENIELSTLESASAVYSGYIEIPVSIEQNIELEKDLFLSVDEYHELLRSRGDTFQSILSMKYIEYKYVPIFSHSFGKVKYYFFQHQIIKETRTDTGVHLARIKIKGCNHVNNVLVKGDTFYIASGFSGYESDKVEAGLFILKADKAFKFAGHKTNQVYGLKLIDNEIWAGFYGKVGIINLERNTLREFSFDRVWHVWHIEKLDGIVWLATTDNFKNIDGEIVRCIRQKGDDYLFEKVQFSDAGRFGYGGFTDIKFDDERIYFPRGDMASIEKLLFWDRKSKDWYLFRFISDTENPEIQYLFLGEGGVRIFTHSGMFDYKWGDSKLSRIVD